MKEILCCLKSKALFVIIAFCFSFTANSQENIYDTDSVVQVPLRKSCFIDSDLKQGGKEYYVKNNLMFYNNDMDILKRSRFIYYIESNFFDKKYPVIRLQGDVEINEKNYNEYKNKNIIFTDGVLQVCKNIEGSIAAFNGIVIINPNSEYENYIYLYNSYLHTDSSFKNNFIICASEDQIVNFENYQALQFNVKQSASYYIYSDLKRGPLFRYNRVEGPFFGLSLDKNFYWNGVKNYSYDAAVGYGFWNHRWTGFLAFDYWIGNYNRMEFGGKVFSLTDSKDNWRIGNTENTLAALAIHEDFKDYFLKEGYLFHITKYYSKIVKLGITFVQDNYRSQQKNYDWAIFGGHKKFRDNPSVVNGVIRSVIFSFNYNSYVPNNYFTGWDINSEFEIASGVTEYNKIFLDVRRYLLLRNIIPFIDNNRARFNIRLMVGAADKELPFQKSFDIGGLGTVPAAGFKILNGNKMLLANLDIAYPVLELFGIKPFGMLEDLTSIIISYDFGFAANSMSNNIFNGFDMNKETVLHGLSVALSAFNEKVRFGAAFRLDKAEPPRLIFRIAQPF